MKPEHIEALEALLPFAEKAREDAVRQFEAVAISKAIEDARNALSELRDRDDRVKVMVLGLSYGLSDLNQEFQGEELRLEDGQ